MRKTIATLVGLTTMLMVALTPQAGAVESADALLPYRGKVTYVDFWASWCGPCAQSFPWLNDMQQKYAKDGLQVVGVGLDTQAAQAERFLKIHPAQFEVLKDPKGELAERYGVEGMPYSVILDAEGRVLHRHSGYRTDDAGEYEQAIQSALAGKLKIQGELK